MQAFSLHTNDNDHDDNDDYNDNDGVNVNDKHADNNDT